MKSVEDRFTSILSNSVLTTTTAGRRGNSMERNSDSSLLLTFRKIALGGALGSLLLLANCGAPGMGPQASYQQNGYQQADTSGNTLIGGLVGAAIGGGIGNISGGRHGRDTRTFIGALLGGGAGAVIGNGFGNSQPRYPQEAYPPRNFQQPYPQRNYQQQDSRMSGYGGQVTQRDEQLAHEAMSRTLSGPLGVSQEWRGPTGNWGVMTAMTEGYAQNGLLCRQVRTTGQIGFQQLDGYGTACRDSYGRWEVSEVSQNPLSHTFASITSSHDNEAAALKIG